VGVDLNEGEGKMKGIHRYAVAALAALALQGCAGAAGRGSSDEGAAPPAAAAAADTSNVVRVEDVKKGMVLTGGLGGGVKLHGFWHTAPLPLPPGEWEVVHRGDYRQQFRIRSQARVRLDLQNIDPTAQVRFIQVSVNTEIGSNMVTLLDNQCFGDFLVVNDFGSNWDAFYNRCGYATYVSDQKEPKINMKFNLETPPTINAPNALEVRLNANRDFGRFTKWGFILVPPPELEDAAQRKAAVARFLQDTGDQVKEFLYNRPALLPDRLTLVP
jgi:hypothetical protein